MIWSVALHLVLILVLSHAYTPAGLSLQWSWFPSLGVSFSIQLDGLSMLFSWLICGIGIFIQLYAFPYMKGKPSSGLFHVYLTLFMLAMLGLVLSGNLILLFIFWELTTFFSYLLIGFNHNQETSRKNALQAILVTGAGGLALLAGLILMGQMAGSYELEKIISNSTTFISDKRFAPALCLILAGAFTKSAQVPFHFWLPGAMSAPAPVSAYLHSATMVKAGVYLLARLAPVFNQSDLWFWSLAVTGGVTAVWTGLLALKQTDVKLMLAYSTNVALGKLVFLLAFGTPFAISAGLMFIVAHALYKAALFMVIGTVDKATGTRDIDRLSGLGPVLKFSFFAAGLSALSKSGIPPFPGFLSKEYMYKAALDVSYAPAILLVIVNSLMAALAMIVVISPFLSRRGAPVLQPKPVEKQLMLWVAPVSLAVLGFLATTVGLQWINSELILPASLSVNPGMEFEPLKLWQGLNLPLVLSGVTLLCGFTLFFHRNRIKPITDTLTRVMPSASGCFESAVHLTTRLASGLTALLQHGRLTGYIFILFCLVAVVMLFHVSGLPFPEPPDWQSVPFYEGLLAAGLLASVTIVLVSGSRLKAVVSLGTAGFITTLFFMFYNAPDVAKTQLLVETLTVIFLVMIVHRLPKLSDVTPHSIGRRIANAGVALTIGCAVFWVVYGITTSSPDTTLVDYYAAYSTVAAHGRNIVNVILVDFRALDTLGEITVVVMAAIGASAILQRNQKEGP